MNPNSKPSLLFFLFSLLSVVFHVSASSSPFNITRGSSLSASPNETCYWLSPSGVFAFGFYPLCYDCNEYTIGVWIRKSQGRTLVWTAQLETENSPIVSSSSILLNKDGVLVLKRPGTTAKPFLFGDGDTLQTIPALYAVMHDTGNFALYASDSDIIWQSFDHATDTILPGQSLKYGHSLLSNNSKYQLRFYRDGSMALEQLYARSESIIWESGNYKKGNPVALTLDSNGRLYLVDREGLATKNLTEGVVYTNSRNVGSTVYRARLGSDGVFRLYAERMLSDYCETVDLWHSYCTVNCNRKKVILREMILWFILLCVLIPVISSGVVILLKRYIL